MILEFCRWLETTPLSASVAGSIWAYPIIESLHTVGIAVFLGLLLVWDLRLLGIMFRSVPVSEIWARLVPWITVGAAFMMLTGVILFVGNPVHYWGHVFFRIKLVALVLALANVLAFHFGIERRLIEWDGVPVPPRAARLAGAASVALWAVVVVAGRLSGYNWFASLVE
jgi:hypothetical protein